MDQTDQKRARSKFFSVDVWRVFGPPSGKKKKEIWFMLKHGQNIRFNFHIIEKLSAPWWLRWKEKNLFDPMGFLWDVYWPHWPSLVQIRGPPSVRHESLAPRISVNPIWNRLWNLHCETGGGKFAPNDFWLWKLPKMPPNVNKMASKWIFGSLALHRHQI